MEQWQLKIDDGYYILDEQYHPIKVLQGWSHPTNDQIHKFKEWAEWMDTHKRLFLDEVQITMDESVQISTVFLGRNLANPGKLFETMVFGGKLDEFQLRCATYEQALIQHRHVVVLVHEKEED